MDKREWKREWERVEEWKSGVGGGRVEIKSGRKHYSWINSAPWQDEMKTAAPVLPSPLKM